MDTAIVHNYYTIIVWKSNMGAFRLHCGFILFKQKVPQKCELLDIFYFAYTMLEHIPVNRKYFFWHRLLRSLGLKIQ